MMSPTSQPLLLEVLAYVPSDFFHCLHCEQLFGAAGLGSAVRREIRSSYPPGMLENAGRLADWLQKMAPRFGEQLHIRIIDPQSIEGFLKSLRYGLRRYPAFIINRKMKYIGWGLAEVENLIALEAKKDE